MLLFVSVCAWSLEEYTDGRVKLILDSRYGKYMIYYMTDVEKKVYEPMFWDKDTRTSYLSVFIDGKIYVLGESASFKTSLRGTETKPKFVFESKDISVTAEFSFIRTASSGVSNGVRIDYTVENWGDKPQNVGLSSLIDTFLGEKNAPAFRTDLRPIETELIIDRTTSDQWWLSRNNKYGLMGSIFITGLESPDFIYFGNWKRLNDSRWKPEYVAGRNFNSLPFSVKDSAVSYYMDVGRIERWQKRQMTILLAAEDIYGFDYNKMDQTFVQAERPAKDGYVYAPSSYPVSPGVIQAVPPVAGAVNQSGPVVVAQNSEVQPRKTVSREVVLPTGSIRIDIQTLRELVAKVDEYIYLETPVSEEELRAMEGVLQRIKLRYGSMY
jgi:hypothetical protein